MATEYFNDAWRIPNNKNQSLVSNYSMEFDNVSNVNLGNAFEGTNEGFTISFWYNTSINQTKHIISKTLNNFEIYSFTDLTLYTYFGSKSKNTNRISVVLNSWQHICYVVTSTEYKGYQNGVLTVTNAFTQTPVYTNNTSDIFLSSRAGGVSSWSGKLDQTCFFDYALPATGTNSVATLYGGGTAVTNPMSLSPKPVSYYQLGDQTASNNTTEPDPPVQSYLVPNNSLQDYVFNFDGTGQVFNLDSEILLPDNKTVSFWFKLRVVPTGQFAILLSNSNNKFYPLLENSSGNFRVYLQGTAAGHINIVTNRAIESNVWYNFIITGDGTTPLLYINGTQYTFGSQADVTGVSIGDIGARPSGSFDLDGDMSNVAIWSGTTLSSTEVTEVYNQGSPLNLNTFSGAAPTAWYKLNAQDTFDGTNWTIKDSAGSNDGTSSGMTSANLVQSNLQHTSGYSPYALSFDGTNDVINCGNDSSLQITGAMTVSYWFKGQGGSNSAGGVGKLGNNGSRGFCLGMTNTGVIYFFIAPTASSVVSASYSHTPDTNWHHLVGVFTPSTSLEIYLDGQSVDTTPTSTSSQYNASNNLQIGARGDSTGFFDGEMSNAAIWNTNLTSTEITEVYNQGVPSNLNTFSGTAPVNWWQLGSNSSFNINWDCLDEIGNNDGVSAGNMTNDAITNGVGYSGNGLGTSSIEIVGDAPYSTANGISENMDVLDRTTDVPS